MRWLWHFNLQCHATREVEHWTYSSAISGQTHWTYTSNSFCVCNCDFHWRRNSCTENRTDIRFSITKLLNTAFACWVNYKCIIEIPTIYSVAKSNTALQGNEHQFYPCVNRFKEHSYSQHSSEFGEARKSIECSDFHNPLFISLEDLLSTLYNVHSEFVNFE